MNRSTVFVVSTIALMPLAATAQVVPPRAEPNRAGNTYLTAASSQWVGSAYRSLSLSIVDRFDLQGAYEYSFVVFDEWGYSYATGVNYGRHAECSIDRGAIKILPNGMAASANVYVADAQNPATCVNYSWGIEPFQEIVADLAGNDPAWVLSQHTAGRLTSGQITQQFSCGQALANEYRNVAVTVNGETWLTSRFEASAHDCRSVSK